MLDKIKRYCLALCIRCPRKAKTKGDILRYALKQYLKNGKFGLCYNVHDAIKHYKLTQDLNSLCHGLLCLYLPLFNQNMAVRLFNGRLSAYWWPLEDWRSRYKYMKWLIKEYDKVEL